ncbi:MAG: SAM-dependent methyltransferase, partial [Alphaproteobacteria bacterium]|nr:SAM-dependent methyltransferase [Alphaproteobacteria bacterium]
NLQATLKQMRRESARKYLKQSASTLLARNPQMCCYSFDAIGVDINIDGRCDAPALRLLLEMLDLRGRNVVDVGANIGNHAAAFAEVAGHVFAFEPHPKTYQLLKLNLSDFPNVKTFQIAASDKAGSVRAVSPRQNFGATTITDRPLGENETAWSFDIAPLDSVTELQDIALIKFDVEGHEAQALRGAENLIRRDKPVIIVEQNREAIAGGSSETVEVLKRSGYSHFYSIDTDLPWRTPQGLPGPVRKMARMTEAILFGPVEWTAHFSLVEKLEPRDYPMLVASTTALTRRAQ